jgi:AAA family ATP:ADP antiporter
MNNRGNELRLVLASGGCFFFLLFGYFLLRPLREAMGVERSMGDLRWLFIVTSFVSLAVVLGFGGLVSRMDRRRCVPIALRVVMACLVVFAILMKSGMGEDARIVVGYVFYVWLSVVNLFMVSVFWALMADTWSLGQGKRIYAMIGVGGTLGAVLGSGFVWTLAKKIDPALQMLCALAMFELAAQSVRLINHLATKNDHEDKTDERSDAVGGSWWDGAKALLSSGYLLGIGVYITLLAISNTLIYFTQAEIVVDGADELSERVGLFAQLDMWTQLATLFVQLFVTGQLIKRLGVGVALSLLPIVTVAGFGILAWVAGRPGIESWQVFGVFAAFQAIHRATRYAVIRPARETLFSVVSDSEKFKAKPIVDVFLYRGGDVAGTGVERLVAWAGLGLAGMAFAVAPMAVLWGGLAIWLAAVQRTTEESGAMRP